MARRKPVVVRFASCELERGNSFIYRDVGVAVATVYFVGNSLRGIAVASRRSPGTELAMICFQGRENNRAVQTCRFSFLKLPRGFCGVSFRHLIRQRSNYYSPYSPRKDGSSALGFLIRVQKIVTRNREAFSKGHVCGLERRSSKLAEVGLAGILRHEIARDTGEETPSSPPWELNPAASCPGNIPCLHPPERISPLREQD